MARLEVVALEGRCGLKPFLELPRRIYRDDPNWVAPLQLERRLHLDPRRNPFWRGIEIRYFLAYRDGVPVGRISAQINRRHLEHHGDSTGHFGFLEAEDCPELFAALLGAAEGWLKERGMRRIAGPFNPSINDECGLLVAGFDRPPSVMMGHARPYYRLRLEELGYRKRKDLIAYDFDVAGDWPERARRLIERARRAHGVRVRPLDMRRYREELLLVCDIFNDAWRDNWGFVPFDEQEALYLGRTIRPFVDAGCFAIGEVEGEAAAMAVTLPNLNEALRDLDGRLLPFGWWKLLWRLKVRGVRSWRMPLMGVRKRYQGTPKGAALALGVIAAAKEYHRGRGVERAELSWVLEDNRPTRELIEAVGGIPYKTYRIYGKELG